MFQKPLFRVLSTLPVLIFCLILARQITAQSTEFTYQGRLLDSGIPTKGTYDFQFGLWDAAAGGTQIGGTQTVAGVTVTNGTFNVNLDFGSKAFADGGTRFLEIEVKPSAGGSYTILSPRQSLTSVPYSIKSRNAAQSDTALDAQKLGGVPASDYVTASTVGNSFIKNDTIQQSANFNISGDGSVGGNLGVGTSTPQSKVSINANGYGLTHTNGNVTLGSFLTSGSGWLGTRSNHPLNFFTNDGGAAMQISTAGDVGVGVTPDPAWKFEVGGTGRFRTTNGNIQLSTPNGETGTVILPSSGNRADFRFNGSIITIAAGTGTGVPGNTGIIIKTDGNVGIGTTAQFSDAKLTVNGGSNDGISAVSTSVNGSAVYAYNPAGGSAITSNGLFYALGDVKQHVSANGLPKAMVAVTANGTIARCYDGSGFLPSPSCNITVNPPQFPSFSYEIILPFQVSNRFWIVTPDSSAGFTGPLTAAAGPGSSAGSLLVTVWEGSAVALKPFHLIVF